MENLAVPHRLQHKDADAKEAVCLVCGPTKIVFRGGFWRCQQSNRQSARRVRIKRLYGLSDEDYALLLSTQDGRCAICATPWTPEAPLHVDHCHETDRVRGLLCFSCNSILGNAKDQSEVLRKAIEYLEMYARI